MSTITLDTAVYQALLSRIEKLETVLYGEVKFKLTELETSLNNKPTTVKKVTKKSVDEAKSTESKPTDNENTNVKTEKVVTAVNDKPTDGAVVQTTTQTATALPKDTLNIVYTKGMNIMEYFKSNYARYEHSLLAINALKCTIDEKVSTADKKAKKNPEEFTRSIAHNVWLSMRRFKDIAEPDQTQVKELVKLIESEHNKLKGGERLGDSVSLNVLHKNNVEIGGAVATVSDDELNKHLEPEDEI